MELFLLLYRLRDAGDYRDKTLERHLTDDLHMTPTRSDRAVYVWREHQTENIAGVTGAYVDESLNAGTQRFLDYTKNALELFESMPRSFGTFTF